MEFGLNNENAVMFSKYEFILGEGLEGLEWQAHIDCQDAYTYNV